MLAPPSMSSWKTARPQNTPSPSGRTSIAQPIAISVTSPSRPSTDRVNRLFLFGASLDAKLRTERCTIRLFMAPRASPTQANSPISGCPSKASTSRLATPRQIDTTSDLRRFASAATGIAGTGCTTASPLNSPVPSLFCTAGLLADLRCGCSWCWSCSVIEGLAELAVGVATSRRDTQNQADQDEHGVRVQASIGDESETYSDHQHHRRCGADTEQGRPSSVVRHGSDVPKAPGWPALRCESQATPRCRGKIVDDQQTAAVAIAAPTSTVVRDAANVSQRLGRA